jgi:hypothetical protein
MIPSTHKRWIGREDFTSSDAARGDDVALARSCWEYLSHRTTGEFEAVRIAPQGNETRLLADLVAASIQASVQRRASEIEARSSNVERLESLLASANATIDRLLAFVPSRAAVLSAERMAVLADCLGDITRQRVPNALNVTVTSIPEQDPNSSASHRVTVRFQVAGSPDMTALSEQIRAIFADLVEQTTSDEFEALRLFVDPEFV